MTITLALEADVRLCEYAAKENRDPAVLVNALLAIRSLDDEVAKEEALDRVLLAAGIITHIPLPRDPSRTERPRAMVQGEPVSKTITRERR